MIGIEFHILFFVACLFIALGYFDNLAAKGIAAAKRFPRALATRSRSNERAVRSGEGPDGHIFYMDTVEMEWRK